MELTVSMGLLFLAGFMAGLMVASEHAYSREWELKRGNRRLEAELDAARRRHARNVQELLRNTDN